MGKSICVFGDLMLDTYVQCTPIKVSSEAPVLICRSGETTYAPGGAANVAANIKTGFGIDVALVGVMNEDQIGKRLQDCLREHSIGFGWSVISENWTTIEKRRIVDTQGRQILRLDTENPGHTTQHIATLQGALMTVLKDNSISTLVISDYGKGTCTPELTTEAIRRFRMAGKYVVVNGKPDKLLSYRGTNILVYNLAEAEAAWAQVAGNDAWLNRAIPDLAMKLYNWLNGVLPPAQRTDVLITCGAQGMVFCNADGWYTQDAVPVKLADVAGAGDTVVATIAAHGYCDKGVLKKAATLAAEVVSQHGTSICNGRGWL